MALVDRSLVSIVTPVYNGAEYLEELIQSVNSQDYPRIEHLIIDDGSDDHGATQAVLRKYPHLRWFHQDNSGQYATLNKGMRLAQGEIICFVSADDVLSPGAVSAAVGFLEKHPHCDGVFGITTRINLKGEDLPYYVPFRTAPLYFYQYFAHISHCSLYVKKAALDSHALTFDPSLKYNGDYDWIIRLHKAGLNIAPLKRELSKVRLHSDQASHKYSETSLAEAKKVVATHRINKPLYYFFNTPYRLLFKVWLLNQILTHEGAGIMFKRLMSRQNSR
jgi:glycosyltransferase involved in cell wall biosynthesis